MENRPLDFHLRFGLELGRGFSFGFDFAYTFLNVHERNRKSAKLFNQRDAQGLRGLARRTTTSLYAICVFKHRRAVPLPRCGELLHGELTRSSLVHIAQTTK